ncbi:hypothetical protein M434DRAFT_8793 [Hypoxylon sp. CO27-5]|nr:hypothetical protein M434DRAFT_8793 [Hypoxylon sp. CO27-5]
MNSSQSDTTITPKKRVHSNAKNLNTSDSPSSLDGVDLLKLAASRDTAIGRISRLNSGTMAASNSPYTPILPPELPVLRRPEPAMLRYQAISNQALRQSSENGHVISSMASVGNDGSSQPRTSEAKIIGQKNGVFTGMLRPSRDHTKQGPYTMSRFGIKGDENKPQGGCVSSNNSNNIRGVPGPKPPPLPYNLDQIYAENRRMSAEAKRIKGEKIRQVVESKRIEAEMKASFRWPGDTSSYPAQATEDMGVSNSELRAKAIHVGTPVTENSPFVGVYAVRRPFNPKTEFRVARDTSSPEEIGRGPLVEFRNIRLNQYFQNMNEGQVELWIRHLLATVPGRNNTVMKWT